MSLIIDCHGHYTTAPKALEAWRNQQIAGIQDASVMPKAADLKISDDELRESIETNQLRLMKERGSDITLFSPRASFMAHHIGDFNVSSTWAAICNELCFRVSQLFPDHFVPVAMLPQSPGVDPATCIPELEKCVKEYGAVGINLNPDPSGGHWNSPPLTDRHWYPIYEKMVEYDLPAMIHVSTSCNACFHTTGAHYLNADTTAFMQCLTSDLFKDFPTLRFLIPHGGGAVPYHWGRFRGLAQELKKPLLQEHLLKNIFFDTCVYHQPGIDLLTQAPNRTNAGLPTAESLQGTARQLESVLNDYGVQGKIVAIRPGPVATLADLLALPAEGKGYEILDSELIEKESSCEHSRAQANLVTRLNSRFGRRPGGRWPGGWWFATEALITFPRLKDPLRPDVAGWRRDKVPVFPSGTVFTDIPDWICEVLSPGNLTNDTIKKKRIYHQAQVGHYWLVDPIRETLQVYRWDQPGYVEILSAERTDKVRAEPFEAHETSVGAFFGDDDEEESP